MVAVEGIPDIPVEAVQTVAAARACFCANLLAAYLHGSAVEGGLQPDSDVDVLLVVERPMSDEMRRRFLDAVMAFSGRPTRTDLRRPLEVVVFAIDDLRTGKFPPRADFLYGEWLRDGFEDGEPSAPLTNPDFAVLVAQTRRVAVTLVGPPPQDLLPPMSAADLRRAIGAAQGELASSLHGDERNVLLTLARMWCTLETGRIVPKQVAAAWAGPRLSPASAVLLDHARLAYLGEVADDWGQFGGQLSATAAELSDRVAGLTDGAAKPDVPR